VGQDPHPAIQCHHPEAGALVALADFFRDETAGLAGQPGDHGADHRGLSAPGHTRDQESGTHGNT
jgi:hypothetical protein